eukprot:TRINITY_DN12129_c0_g1_i8.p2 TRINITY_DN12129_c0_g1~~TRINITY_DN12129_c0_g1_i8.p2  ORF type:complete len:228 (-),score=-13.20 TRINITY_DN12129_c0_g1_i8:431-1114(-)
MYMGHHPYYMQISSQDIRKLLYDILQINKYGLMYFQFVFLHFSSLKLLIQVVLEFFPFCCYFLEISVEFFFYVKYNQLGFLFLVIEFTEVCSFLQNQLNLCVFKIKNKQQQQILRNQQNVIPVVSRLHFDYIFFIYLCEFFSAVEFVVQFHQFRGSCGVVMVCSGCFINFVLSFFERCLYRFAFMFFLGIFTTIQSQKINLILSKQINTCKVQIVRWGEKFTIIQII